MIDIKGYKKKKIIQYLKDGIGSFLITKQQEQKYKIKVQQFANYMAILSTNTSSQKNQPQLAM